LYQVRQLQFLFMSLVFCCERITVFSLVRYIKWSPICNQYSESWCKIIVWVIKSYLLQWSFVILKQIKNFGVIVTYGWKMKVTNLQCIFCK
jgi:hypothetical protein